MASLRADGRLDWLPEGGGEPHGYTEFMATVDALVIGRKTFETVLSFPQWPYGTKPVIVLTSRPTALQAPPGAMCIHGRDASRGHRSLGRAGLGPSVYRRRR